MDLTKLNNKKILITNHNLINFAGSELTTYYLAKEFIKLGNLVSVATFNYDYPIKKLFEENNITVYNLLKDFIPSECYDLIWAHHTPVLSNCLFEKNISSKRIIFSSLSPYEPLEAPPVYTNLLSLCLANSYETRDKLITEGIDKENIYVFNNSVDDSFLTGFSHIKECKLNKLCIISNHVPKELRIVEILLKEHGIGCDIFGIYDKAQFINEKLLANYDAIISIGRSVQYGLSLGIPVYCYDRFGGPGWINTDNIEHAEYFNFSGRCCNRQADGNTIYNEILSGFEFAFSQRNSLFEHALERYSLKSNISNSLDLILEKPFSKLLVFEHFYMLKRTNGVYGQRLESELSKSTLLITKENEIKALNNTLSEIYSSRGWRLLNHYYKCKKSFVTVLKNIFSLGTVDRFV